MVWKTPQDPCRSLGNYHICLLCDWKSAWKLRSILNRLHAREMQRYLDIGSSMLFDRFFMLVHLLNWVCKIDVRKKAKSTRESWRSLLLVINLGNVCDLCHLCEQKERRDDQIARSQHFEDVSTFEGLWQMGPIVSDCVLFRLIIWLGVFSQVDPFCHPDPSCIRNPGYSWYLYIYRVCPVAPACRQVAQEEMHQRHAALDLAFQVLEAKGRYSKSALFWKSDAFLNIHETSLTSTYYFTMFCKSLTMHTHLRKWWLAFSCVLWPGSKSTSCDDAGGPSVRKVARWCYITLNDVARCWMS